MNWISTIGRKVLVAYTEGLTMKCPMHRTPGDTPARIDALQDNVRPSSNRTVSPVRH
jgi:hypothetical protein